MNETYPLTTDTPYRRADGSWRDNWRDDAECAGTDPELFFIESTAAEIRKGKSDKRPVADERAIAACGRCAVASFCLDEAMEENIGAGRWGGLTTDERKALKKRTRQQSSRR